MHVFQGYHEGHQKRESENATKLGIPTHLTANIRKSMESSRYENDDVDFCQHEMGQMLVSIFVFRHLLNSINSGKQ